MKKEDLKYGNVIENRRGDKYLIGYDKRLRNLTRVGYVNIDDYDENLKCIYYPNFLCPELDIVKVYEDYTCQEVLWERKDKPVLTEDEKTILKNLPKKFKYIARDKNGNLWIYEIPVEKHTSVWEMSNECKRSDVLDFEAFEHLFQFIKWEDEEPYSIKELLNDK